MEPSAVDSLIFDDRQRGRFLVDRRAFTDQEIWAREQERIFNRCWLYVGHESELPRRGDFVTRRVGGRPLIMSRGSDGRVRVFANTCTHRGAMVCRQRTGNAKTFQCFYHAWTFDNQGQLVGVPGEDAYGPGFRREELRLYEPRCESYRGLVFACFNRDTEPLPEYLAGTLPYIDLVLDQGGEQGMEILPGTHEYCMQANWKMLMENSVDGYHFATTHHRYVFQYLPEVMGYQPDPKTLTNRGRVMDVGHGHTVSVSPRINPTLDSHRQRELENLYGKEKARQLLEEIRSLVIFPNLLILEFLQTVRTCFPIAPDMMEINAWALMQKTDSPEVRAQRLQGFLAFLGPGGSATPDDVEVLESCQKGFAAAAEVPWSDNSRRLTGAPHSDGELQMRVYWKHWNAIIAGPGAAA